MKFLLGSKEEGGLVEESTRQEMSKLELDQ